MCDRKPYVLATFPAYNMDFGFVAPCPCLLQHVKKEKKKSGVKILFENEADHF